MKNENITLYFKEGTSDKVYQASLEQKGEPTDYVVNFGFARRGDPLKTGTKTTKPVPYAKAKAIYDKLVKEKQAKGYTQGEDGVRFQSTVNESRSTGVIPQLLNAIDAAQLEALILNPRFVLQEKLDGERRMIRLQGGVVEGINRKGLVVALPQPIARTVNDARDEDAKLVSVLLDGEIVGDSFIAFDVLELNGVDLRKESFRDRLIVLQSLAWLTAYGSPIQRVETAIGSREKRCLFNRLMREGKEGVVAKDLDTPYVPGRPNSGGSQLKHKFYETASFVVSLVNNQRSVLLGLYKAGKLIPVGNVTIPANHDVPVIGDIVEVRYLYAFNGGSVYQPTYLGRRNDLDKAACKFEQLKFKSENQKEKE